MNTKYIKSVVAGGIFLIGLSVLIFTGSWHPFFSRVAKSAVTSANFAPVVPHTFSYVPGPARATAEPPRLTVSPARELRPLIIADGMDCSPNLARMVARQSLH